MINILHVIPTLTRAGAESQLVNLVRHTTNEEVTHAVCFLHPPDDLAGELRNLGIETICLNLPRKWPWLFAPWKLVPLLRARRPDFIQTRLLDADLSARLSTILGPSIPIINTLHMPTYDPKTIRLAGWPVHKMAVLKRLDRWTARATRPQFVAISESVKRSAVRNLGLSPAGIAVIQNSIDQTTLQCDPEEPAHPKRRRNPGRRICLSDRRAALTGKGPTGAAARLQRSGRGGSGYVPRCGRRWTAGHCARNARKRVRSS